MPRTTPDDYKLQLNFVPLTNDPATTIFRRARGSQDARPEGVYGYRLPTDSEGSVWSEYWVSLSPMDGFTPFQLSISKNVDLGRRLLLEALTVSARKLKREDELILPANPFLQELSIVMATHKEGREVLTVQPYYLHTQRKLGFLVDFRFVLNPKEPFTRQVQVLSLSLTRNFRRNTDFYVDKFSKVRGFLVKAWDVFSDVRLPSGHELSFSKDFVNLPAECLIAKSYIFGSGKEKKAQYAGLREFGPLKGLANPPHLLFIFREQDRPAARRLAMALRGAKKQTSSPWPGFETIFKSSLELDANPIVLNDLHEDEMRRALGEAEARAKTCTGQLVPVLVLPTGDDNGYLTQKAIFANAALPTQVCTLKILDSEDSLKWAIANLALQIFCKAGGKPWKVKSASKDSLIIGISHSHKVREIDGKPVVEKYFAFSVLTDSTGLFRNIEVLGEAADHASYLDHLRANLRQMLKSQAAEFKKVVLHTSFRLKLDEIKAIEAVTREVAQEHVDRQFAVVKVNQQNRFFGFNRDLNSLVPYEATKVALGPHEYLMWFEGISPDKENVSKLFAGPTHLQFLKVSDAYSSDDEEHLMLQDLVNLSGANWRGFNAKSAPVSVFYCHLVAKLVHNFHEQGLPLPSANDEHPWFL